MEKPVVCGSVKPKLRGGGEQPPTDNGQGEKVLWVMEKRNFDKNGQATELIQGVGGWRGRSLDLAAVSRLTPAI